MKPPPHVTLVTPVTPISHNNMSLTFIFDWDNTLFCHDSVIDHATELGKHCLDPSIISVVRARLGHELEDFETSLISLFQSLLHNAKHDIIIVTAAEDGWIQETSKHYLPLFHSTFLSVNNVRNSSYFSRYPIRLFSARHFYRNNPLGETVVLEQLQKLYPKETVDEIYKFIQENETFVWKFFTSHVLLMNIADHAKLTGLLKDIFVVGDRQSDIDSVHQAALSCGLTAPQFYFKFLKLCEKPSMQQMRNQFLFLETQILSFHHSVDFPFLFLVIPVGI